MTNDEQAKVIAPGFLADWAHETLLRLFFGELGKILNRNKSPGRCIGIKRLHFDSSPARISCPALRETIAFFQSVLYAPRPEPMRRNLPWTRIVLTETTCTLKSSSMADLMSRFDAPEATRNRYWLAVAFNWVARSVISGFWMMAI